MMILSEAGFVLWMCAASRILSAALPSTLSIIKCEILEYTSITCYWETTNQAVDHSSYRLQVNKADCDSKESFFSEGLCDTRGSHCSIQPINSHFHCFCADVLANTSDGSIRSPHFCFNGINQVKLHPPAITYLDPVAGRPDCLQMGWKMRYTLPEYEKSLRWLQVEYTTHEQTRSQTFQAYAKDRIELCHLYPGSRYTVKLRAQDSRAPTHWSSWTSKDNKTLEKAPSDAPRLWRHIRPAEETRKRHLTLLWKPLSWPEANGVVLSYTASCRSDVDSSQWTCGTLDASITSCDLTVSLDACNCSLTAANSAGTSPPSYIFIPGQMDEKLPAPTSISIISLDDTRLKLEWTTAPNQSETGFVVQWIYILPNETTGLHWQHLNETSRSFILTGLLPEVPYNLSVTSLYEGIAGGDTSLIAFTREGAPSVGPQLTVLKTSAKTIHLQWDPVPIEKLHGFIKKYSILYSINGKDKREQVEGDVEQIYLNGLMEGTYNICVMAHTVAGGAAGPWQIVALGYDDVQITPILMCALLLIFIILILPVCMRVRIKRCLYPTIPDPSKSTMSAWSNCKPGQNTLAPSSTLSSFFSNRQTTRYSGYGEKDYSPVQVLSPQAVKRTTDNMAQPNICNYTSIIKTTEEPNLTKPNLQVDFINRSYIRTDKIMSECCQDGCQSSNEPFLHTVFSYQSVPTAQKEFCDYIHVSHSSLSGVTIVDSYRTLDSDECPRVFQGLPEDHGT
ncbi:interleukin-6 receptor subunit beta isoform X1 [Paramisgurnus dabryanus]|uniref:interleukin-6 receptor subunit beta isoform X1 n=2 Tax=Paramisgurnus dabryanus TaxID=90735 RepID=UPI0031F40408